jgi:hypothetical protein
VRQGSRCSCACDARSRGSIHRVAQLNLAGKGGDRERKVGRAFAEAESKGVVLGKGADNIRVGAARLAALRVEAELVRSHQVRVRIDISRECHARNVRRQAHKVAQAHKVTVAATRR